MRKSQNFWDKNAGRYDRFMRKDGMMPTIPMSIIGRVTIHEER